MAKPSKYSLNKRCQKYNCLSKKCKNSIFHKHQLKQILIQENTSFNLYIFKVLRQILPESSISKKGMAVMNSFMVDVFNRLACQASRMRRFAKRKTLSVRDIQSAVRLLLTGELAEIAICNGVEAVNKFMNSKKKLNCF